MLLRSHCVPEGGQAFTHSQLNECQHFYVTLSILETVSCHGNVGTDGPKSGESREAGFGISVQYQGLVEVRGSLGAQLRQITVSGNTVCVGVFVFVFVSGGGRVLSVR